MSFLSQLSWRYATKRFDPTKKVSEDDLQKILEAIRMAPSSFGLQPFHFYVIRNPEVKEKISSAAFHQPQINTSSDLIVFTARTDLMAVKDEYLDLMSGGNPEARAGLEKFDQALIHSIHRKEESGSVLAWATHQAYITFGFALAACAELGIDSCPMEGADFAQIDTILGLPATEKSALLLPIGYRASDDAPRTQEKVRFPESALFTFIGE